MIAATYYIPDSLKAEIEARAEQEGRSASAMAVRLLREALGPKEKVKAPDWAEDYMEIFWERYPRKTNKKKAMDLMRSMIISNPNPDFWSNVISDVRNRFRSIENKKFIPHATTYLNGARWEDEVIHEDSTRNPQNRIERVMQQAGEVEQLFGGGCSEGERHVGPDDATVQEQMGLPGRRD